MSAQQILTPADRESWLAARRQCVTATDVAALLDLSDYESAFTVYLDKLGLRAEKEQTEAMSTGLFFERHIADYWSMKTGRAVRQSHFYTHREEPWCGATPDFELEDCEDEGLEVKMAGYFAGREFGDRESDQIVDRYLIQAQWQMWVTGWKRIHFAVLINGNDWRYYIVDRDEQIIRMAVYEARKFWFENVLKQRPPALTGHTAEVEYIRHANPDDSGAVIAATPEIDEVCGRLRESSARLKMNQREVDGYKAEIQTFMGDAAILETIHGKVTWKKPKPTIKTNWEMVAKGLNPPDELISVHTREVENSRRFCTYFKEK